LLRFTDPERHSLHIPSSKIKLPWSLGAGQSGNPDSKFWGNGAAISKVLSTSGAKVIACEVNLKAAHITATRIQADGGICDAIHTDATSQADIRRTINRNVEKQGRIDILLNNVAGTKTGDPATMSEEAWDAQIRLNLRTVFLSCNAVLPIMEKQGLGSIINNASVAGMR
jgi:NAD(P)-dependent dehydrogenase (short-subunit alcohol dehydrogenase family)